MELVGESRGSISGCFELSQGLLAWRQAELVAMILGDRLVLIIKQYNWVCRLAERDLCCFLACGSVILIGNYELTKEEELSLHELFLLRRQRGRESCLVMCRPQRCLHWDAQYRAFAGGFVGC